ncbi:hypothetical protein LMG6000_00417 [Achromobacter insolitus]|uniref:Tyr recombinase domain-containing protein n=1 Tax=Achromobacter insolitus TaxID=217204 RepID=A0A6S7EVL1_9BURK|nr:hypothetical protein LMG6000_00417 [Achromobacter insolitus]CAB3944827.1 hypothetical protein LMG5997_05468 [Achromobacter insolitus]
MSYQIAIVESVESVVSLLDRTAIAQWSLSRHISALRRLGAWHFVRFGCKPQFPVSPETINLYIRDVAEGGENTNRVVEQLMLHGYKQWYSKYTAKMLRRDLAVFSVLHSQHNWPDPCISPSIENYLAQIRQKEYKAPCAARRGQPMLLSSLIALLETCDDSLVGIRDRAILLLAWTTGIRKVSELGRVTRTDLIQTDYGYQWPLPPDIAGIESRTWWRATTIEGVAAAALDAWIDLSGFREGPLFFAARPTSKTSGLTTTVVTGMLARRARMARLNENFTCHCFGMGYDLESARDLPSLSFKLVSIPIGSSRSFRSRREVDHHNGDASPVTSHADEALRELDDLLRI